MQFRFADYMLDIKRRELRRGSDPIAVEPQVFDLLVHLVQNRERVVSKDDLIASVWRGRIVSNSTLTSRVNAVRKSIADNGQEQRLIRTIARKGFRFVGDVSEQWENGERASVGPATNGIQEPPRFTPLLPDRPAIAVLPFINISGDHEQEYFSDGIVEEIITALSRIRWLFVIARSSSFTFKGRSVDVKQVSQDLGVRYILAGSVRKATDRIRITAQLIDASTGIHLWAERFDGGLEDVFELQDQVAARVVGEIAPKLEQAEIERANRKPTQNLDAYDNFLRGLANVHQWTRAANDEALRLFYKAIELDHRFASAYGMAAWCYIWRKLNGWVIDGAQESSEGARLARHAVELGKDDAVALSRGGHALVWFVRDLDNGAAYIDRALVLNPNLAAAWNLSGWVRAYRGELDLAIEHHARAMSLSPLDPILYNMHVGIAFAHFLAGRYHEAIGWANSALREQPNNPAANRVLAASNALASHLSEAHEAMAHMRELDPSLRVSNLGEVFPLRPDDLAKFAEGLRKAGLPD